jgi:TolA-binding protein
VIPNAHDRLLDALRVEPEPVDDITRARWLANMSPELDAIAQRHQRRHAPARRVWWLAPALAAATVLVVLAWWTGRATAPSVVAEPAYLRPYVVSRPAHDSAATTLLAGRFAALDIGAGELVRATLDDAGTHRIGAIGPAHLSVARTPHGELELVGSGTLLVDAHGPLVVRPPGLTLRTQQATFAVASSGGRTVIFVDRGELFVDHNRLAAGDWFGPDELRSSALVQQLRDHANALPPPGVSSGILAVEGDGDITTRRGSVLGAAPVWVRIAPAPVELVAMGARDRVASAEVRYGAITRVSLIAPPDETGARPQFSPPPTPTAALSPPPSTTAALAKTGARPQFPTPDKTGARPLFSTPPNPTAAPAQTGARPQVSPPPSATAAKTGARPLFSTPDQTGARPLFSTPSAPEPAAPAVTESAAQLYARAEAALRAGKRGEAETTLRELVTRFPESAEAASALYDLATLVRTRDPDAARGYLVKLLANAPPDALLEPAHYLRCRIDADTNAEEQAATCFTRFRSLFPRSTHDAEVLAWLAGRAERQGGCAAAATLATEYLRRYPTGAFAKRASTCGGQP